MKHEMPTLKLKTVPLPIRWLQNPANPTAVSLLQKAAAARIHFWMVSCGRAKLPQRSLMRAGAQLLEATELLSHSYAAQEVSQLLSELALRELTPDPLHLAASKRRHKFSLRAMKQNEPFWAIPGHSSHSQTVRIRHHLASERRSQRLCLASRHQVQTQFVQSQL